jgi:hypothetical protein
MAMIDGKELIVTPASFAEAMAMQEVIAKALQEKGIKIDLSSVDITEKNLKKMELGDVGWVLDPILTLTTDSEIRKHLFVCAERAMFDKSKVNADLFEESENRKYYYPIMMEVLKVNIAPFFGLASSLFKNLPGLTDMLQKLQSAPPK